MRRDDRAESAEGDEYRIVYFKRSGKLYASETVKIPGTMMNDIVEHVKHMLRSGKPPGLSGWHGDFHVVIFPIGPTEYGFPCMIPIGSVPGAD
jgi:hypothetical protein